MKADQRQNFRQVFQFKNVDGCDVLNNPDKYPLLKDGIKNFNKGMPGIIQKCPYKVKTFKSWKNDDSLKLLQELKVCNATFGPPSESTDRSVTDFRIFPNGIYKLILAIADHKEFPKNTASVTLFYESRFRSKNFESSAWIPIRKHLILLAKLWENFGQGDCLC